MIIGRYLYSFVITPRRAQVATLSRVLHGFSMAAIALGSTICFPQEAWGQDFPGETGRAMAGLVHVGIPTPAHEGVALAGSAGYGWFEPIGELEGSTHRLSGQVAAAYSFSPQWSLGLDLKGRVDIFSDEGVGSPLYGEPRITGRYSHSLSTNLHLGAEADIRFVGAEAPSVNFSSTSPSLRGLLGAKVAERTWLAAELGFFLDLSGNKVEPDDQVDAAAAIALGASSSPSIPWGVGVSHRLTGPGTELLFEASGELLVGSKAPPLVESPMRLSFGARQELLAGLSLLAGVDLGLSARPDTFSSTELVPMEPRLAGGLTLAFRWEEEEVAPAVQPEVKKETPKKKVLVVPPPVLTSRVSGLIVDEGGRPIPDVQVLLHQEGAEVVSGRSAADGSFDFPKIPNAGELELVISTSGFDEARVTVAEGEERRREVVLYPSLPAGQVRGAVLDLSGQAVGATIVISPGDQVVEAKEDGSFDLELAPGRYTLRFEHKDFANQKRVVVVEDRGVVILNIALSP